MKKLSLILVLICLMITFTGCSKEYNLSDYIDNYQDVINVIGNQLGESEINIKQDTSKESDIATLEQFGNGNFYLLVNGIEFRVICSDRIATYISYFDGNYYTTIPTETFTKLREEQSQNMIDKINEETQPLLY